MRKHLGLILIALASFACLSAQAAGQVSSSQTQKQTANTEYNTEDLSGKHVVGIEFKGTRIFSDEQLLDQMRYTKRLNRATFPAFDFTYSSGRMDADLRSATFFMRSHGYLRAEIGEPGAEVSGNGVKLIMPVEEGTLYRIGKIKVRGATVFSPEEVIKFLNVEPGGIANGKEIGDGLYERLKRAYGERGYIQYTAEPTPTFHPVPDGASEGVVDFKIDIDEGILFYLHSINFEGSTPATYGLLRNALLVQEGGVYDQTKFEESIRNLNELGLFEEINREIDADFKTNEENHQIDITIRVKEIGNP